MTSDPTSDPMPGGPVPPGPGGDESEAVAQPMPEAQPEAVADAVEGDVLEGEVLDGEVVEPTTSEEAESEALLAEALDADAIEAQFAAAEADLGKVSGMTAVASDEVAMLTADLQRVHAEYSNYRKRVERDRALVRERAVESVLVDLLPILDDIGRARDHDELVGGFKGVGESLEALANRLGLTPFGAAGEPFDPTRHEALMRQEIPGVTEPTVAVVLQTGYEMHGRVLRPARVAVAGTE